MKIFLKVIDKLKKQPQCRNPAEADLICKYNKGWNDALEKVEELITSYNLSENWIPVDMKLPPEPDERINVEDLPDYIVMIKGANLPTSLVYAGDNTWVATGVGGDVHYPVIAWMPMPKPYKEDKK